MRIRHAARSWIAMCSVIGLAAGAVASPPVASATPRARAATLGDQEVINRHAGLCLDDKSKGTANGATVDLWTCNGGRNQVWDITFQVAPQSWQLINRYSAKCLDVYKKGTTNGTPMVQWTCDANDTAQLFTLNSVGSYNGHDLYYMQPLSARSACVEDKSGSLVDGAIVDIWSCNGGANQLWW